MILIILSCNFENQTNSRKQIHVEKGQKITCSIKFKLGENDSSYYYIRHCSIEKKNMNNGVSFIYSGDSSNFVNDSITHIDSLTDYRLTYRINKSNDTIFNTIKEGKSLQYYTFSLLDSLNVQIDSKTVRLYVYERIHDENEWDEVLYFSKELGLVYGYSKFFKGDKSLMLHSKIDTGVLDELRSYLKKQQNRWRSL